MQAHLQMEGQPTPPPKKRRRPPLACIQCRKRKKKCDQERPCNNCSKANIGDCTFPADEGSALRGLDSGPLRSQRTSQASVEISSRDSPSIRVLSRMQERASHNRVVPEPSVTPVSSRVASSTLQPGHVTGQSSQTDTPLSSDALLERIRQLEATVTNLSNQNAPSTHDLPASRGHAAGEDASGLRFGNQSAWINGTSLPLGLAQKDKSPLRDAMADYKALSGRLEQHFAPRSSTAGPPGVDMPPRVQVDVLIEGYFAHFEGWLRILHRPSFYAEYERFWQEPGHASDVFVLQLKVCMALGTNAFPQGDGLTFKAAAAQWLADARRWLDASATRKKRPSLEELQLACLVLVAEANAAENDQMHHCWVSAGQLVRQAMLLGLHREPRLVRPMTFLQAELRRRLWVTVLELNLILSLQAGQPTTMSVPDYDSQPPSNIDDDELGSMPEEADPAMHVRPGPSPQLALFASFRLRSQLVDKLNGIGQAMSYDEVLQFHAKLSKAKGKMQQTRAHASSSSADTREDTQNVVVSIVLSRYLLALHLPVLGRSIRNPNFHFSRRFCVTTSLDMIRLAGILDGSHSGVRANDAVPPSVQRLFANSPGLFRHIAIQAIFAVALELVTSMEEERDDDGAFPVWDAPELFACLEAAERWSANRLRAGITDNRAYCFIGACIAYVEAGTEAGDISSCVVEAAQRNAHQSVTFVKDVMGLLDVAVEPVPAMDPSTAPATVAGAGQFGAFVPDVMDVAADLPSSFFGVGMDGFAFDWTYPMDFGQTEQAMGQNQM